MKLTCKTCSGSGQGACGDCRGEGACDPARAPFVSDAGKAVLAELDKDLSRVRAQCAELCQLLPAHAEHYKAQLAGLVRVIEGQAEKASQMR